MKITNLTAQVNKLFRKGAQEIQKPLPPEAAQKTSDSLEISSRAKEIEGLVAKAMAVPGDNDRVREIKERIADGTYEIDSKKLAKKMLSRD